ncbi:hypothetical protein BSL78_08875 [Apostichopus japonicus]|uniref:Reverse transcriptase domain-containing protein n=1 Tax=Stichopus japonicus TaxID=307972 RepID=A0A2G8L1V8_STIJA|nr:hypothetical protein BSL78_08875 [Apostichopus japonicus]
MDVQDLFETLPTLQPCTNSTDTTTTQSKYELTMKTLDDYFTPKVNVPYERHIFRQMKLEESDTVHQFIARLTRQAVNCEFGQESKEHIRDQVIDKCNSSALRRKLLTKGTGLKLDDLQEISRAMETVDAQMKAMKLENNHGSNLNTEKSESVNRVGQRSNQSVKPVAQSVRRIPFSLRPKVKDKLKELMEQDIIEEVNGPTPWVSPVVIVPKSGGDIRLCVDMRLANDAIIRERHPIPTVEEVLYEMNGSSLFTKLDLKWGFHQIE